MAQARADRSAARASLLDAFDRQHQVEATARLVARHLTLGHPPEYAYQILEARVRQFSEWGNTEPGRHILIAVARYLAAHSPTERA